MLSTGYRLFLCYQYDSHQVEAIFVAHKAVRIFHPSFVTIVSQPLIMQSKVWWQTAGACTLYFTLYFSQMKGIFVSLCQTIVTQQN